MFISEEMEIVRELKKVEELNLQERLDCSLSHYRDIINFYYQ